MIPDNVMSPLRFATVDKLLLHSTLSTLPLLKLVLRFFGIGLFVQVADKRKNLRSR